MSVLQVKHLSTELKTLHGTVKAVRDVSFQVEKGEIVAVVGESGCGKTMMCMSIINLFPGNRGVIKEESQIFFHNKNICNISGKEMKKIRGGGIGIIVQDPFKALNPTEKIGKQIVDIICEHEKISKKDAKNRALELLEKVGISEPKRRFSQYPHELSGGMRQRIVISMAIACHPDLLIADEPTTALDVTIQAEVLEVIKKLQREYHMSILLVTHNLGIVASVADKVMVMYAGKIVEMGTTEQVLFSPRHPYTNALLKTVSSNAGRKDRFKVIPGTPPNLINPPKGCPFIARCEKRMNICNEVFPKEVTTKGHSCHCFLYDPEYLVWKEESSYGKTIGS